MGYHDRSLLSRSLLLALIFFPFWLFRLTRTQPSLYRGEVSSLTGRVISVVSSSRSQRLTLDRLNLGSREMDGMVSIVTWPFPRFRYGDLLALSGDLEVPESYLINRGISAEAAFPSLGLIDSASSIGLTGSLLQLREQLERLFLQLLPEPQASLLAGLLLGSQRSLPKEFAEALRNSGTTHVVVASGFNVSVVIAAIIGASTVLGNLAAVPLSLLGIMAYTVLAGATPPVVRAAIMGTLAFLGQRFQREPDTAFALSLSAAVMLLIRPRLLWDASFQLSFSATAGMVFLSPKISKFFRCLPRALANTLAETLSAQLATFPVLFLSFGSPLSLRSLATNLLVVGSVPLSTWFGIFTLTAALIWRPLGQLLAYVTWVPLTYFVLVVRALG